MRNVPRRRLEVSGSVITALSPLFRYSRGRDAYVLRGVGRRVGPVLRVRADPPPGRFTKDPVARDRDQAPV